MKITTKIGGFVNRRRRQDKRWEFAIPITREISYDTDQADEKSDLIGIWYNFIIDHPYYDIVELYRGNWF